MLLVDQFSHVVAHSLLWKLMLHWRNSLICLLVAAYCSLYMIDLGSDKEWKNRSGRREATFLELLCMTLVKLKRQCLAELARDQALPSGASS